MDLEQRIRERTIHDFLKKNGKTTYIVERSMWILSGSVSFKPMKITETDIVFIQKLTSDKNPIISAIAKKIYEQMKVDIQKMRELRERTVEKDRVKLADYFPRLLNEEKPFYERNITASRMLKLRFLERFLHEYKTEEAIVVLRKDLRREYYHQLPDDELDMFELMILAMFILTVWEDQTITSDLIGIIDTWEEYNKPTGDRIGGTFLFVVEAAAGHLSVLMTEEYILTLLERMSEYDYFNDPKNRYYNEFSTYDYEQFFHVMVLTDKNIKIPTLIDVIKTHNNPMMIAHAVNFLRPYFDQIEFPKKELYPKVISALDSLYGKVESNYLDLLSGDPIHLYYDSKENAEKTMTFLLRQMEDEFDFMRDGAVYVLDQLIRTNKKIRNLYEKKLPILPVVIQELIEKNMKKY